MNGSNWAPASRSERGSSLAEFALVLPLLLLVLLAVMDFGHLIETRLVMTNLSREGASIASRAAVVDAEITKMMMASGNPLDMTGPNIKIYVSRIQAGLNSTANKPKLMAQISSGTLNSATKVINGSATLGLGPTIYNHLVYNNTNKTANIAEVTVVEVYYKYIPITPLPNFMTGFDKTGFVLSSKAVF